MPGHLSHLEHEGLEFLENKEKPNRGKVNKDSIELTQNKKLDEEAKERLKAELQAAYLSPENDALFEEC